MLTPSMQLMLKLSTLQSKMTKRIDGQLSIHGISYTEFTVMYQLNLVPNKTMRRISLAESIGLSASGVTRLLAPMEKINLVEKESNKRDARVSLVKLTDSGQKLLQDTLISFEQVSDNLTKPLDTKQVNQLYKLLDKL